MSDLTGKIIGMFVAGLLASVLLPTAISNFFTANQTGWSTTTKTIWNLSPVLLIIALFVSIIAYVKITKR